MFKFQTMKGTKIHAMPNKGEQITRCGLYAQMGDKYVDPSRKVTCKWCLATLAAG